MSTEFKTRKDPVTGQEIPTDKKAVFKMCEVFALRTSATIKELRDMKGILDVTVSDRRKIGLDDNQVDGLMTIKGVFWQAEQTLSKLATRRRDKMEDGS